MAYLGKTPSQAVRSRYFYTATGGETSLSGADNNGDTLVFADGNYVDVYLNGVLLVAGTDYNVNTTNTIAGLAALTASDIVEIVVYDTFSVFGGTFQGTLTANQFVGPLTGNVTGELDGSVNFTAKNIQGSTILKGTPVYIAGHSGNTPEIAIADADVAAKMPAFGIAATDIANNNKGSVVVFGDYIGIDTSTFAVGDELYVSNTGTLTTTRPSGSADQVQKIAKVIRSQSQNGQIFVMGAGRSNDTPNAITANSINLGSSTTVSSVLDEDTMTSDSATALATQQSIKAYVDNQIGSNNELSEILTNGNTTGGNNIAFADNDKAIFGAGSDLQIFHDGSNSWINEVGTGQLILAGEDVRITTPNAGEFMATFGVNGAATLYYDNAAKFATTATGVDVTGTVTTDGVTSSAAITSQTGGSNSAPAIAITSGSLGINGITAPLANTLGFVTGTAERLRIDSTGNVSIGTAATPEKLSIEAPLSTLTGLGLTYSGATKAVFSVLPSTGEVRIGGTAANYFPTFYSSGTEAMRIDSSGNLLVGTTTNGTTADGTVIRASAETLMTRSNGAPLLLNRRGTDGAVIEVRNDNSAVGYISANASGMGVYLGGTGAANHLDDYEEGTWTPEFQATITNFSSITYNSNQHKAYYVKVGNIVHITLYTRVDAFSGGSGSLRIAGLPFNMGGTGSSAGGAAGYIQNWNSTFSIHGATLATDQIYLNKNGNNTTPVTVSDMRNSNDSNQMSMSFSYRTA